MVHEHLHKHKKSIYINTKKLTTRFPEKKTPLIGSSLNFSQKPHKGATKKSVLTPPLMSAMAITASLSTMLRGKEKIIEKEEGELQ